MGRTIRRSTAALMLLAVGCFLWTACGSREEVAVNLEPAASESSDAIFYVVRMMASLLKEKPEAPETQPGEIMTVQQGDQVTVLERGKDWSKIRHQKSGEIGWLHTSFLQIERQSRWWSGDTEKARRVARKIYQDKIMTEQKYPIVHVSIEERFNKLLFETASEAELTREHAQECGEHWLSRLVEEFPTWPEHNIFLTAREGGTSYTMVMGSGREATFL